MGWVNARGLMHQYLSDESQLRACLYICLQGSHYLLFSPHGPAGHISLCNYLSNATKCFIVFLSFELASQLPLFTINQWVHFQLLPLPSQPHGLSCEQLDTIFVESSHSTLSLLITWAPWTPAEEGFYCKCLYGCLLTFWFWFCPSLLRITNPAPHPNGHLYFLYAASLFKD